MWFKLVNLDAMEYNYSSLVILKPQATAAATKLLCVPTVTFENSQAVTNSCPLVTHNSEHLKGPGIWCLNGLTELLSGERASYTP